MQMRWRWPDDHRGAPECWNTWGTKKRIGWSNLSQAFIQVVQTLINSTLTKHESHCDASRIFLSEFSPRVVTEPGPYPTYILLFIFPTWTETALSWSTEFVSDNFCYWGCPFNCQEIMISIHRSTKGDGWTQISHPTCQKDKEQKVQKQKVGGKKELQSGHS